MKSGFETRGPNEPEGGKSAFVPPTVEQLARLFPQLEILELLGQGGMGAVYKARQPALDRLVALKILPPQSAKDPGFAERFNREARALARLSHPNIVAVYDFGQAVDVPYFLMEYVEGWTLREVVRSGRLSPADTIRIVMQICEALQFAHDEGVVHRDIKPENILLDQKGRVKIADFGIAKVLDQPTQDIGLTGARDVVGTAPYMAPEQIENPHNVDHRADIFSLGVVFYELLTGELPLGKFQSPSQRVQVDVRLDDVVLHTLEKEPERRYQHASEVRTDVATIEATTGAALPPLPNAPPLIPPLPPPPGGRSTGVNVTLLLGALGAFALLVLLGIGVLLLARVRMARSTSSPIQVVSSNAAWRLLNEDQRLFVRLNEQQYRTFLEKPDFIGEPTPDRAVMEGLLIDALKESRSTARGRGDDYYKAINTLAAISLTNALPLLRGMAFEHADKMLRSEISNRRRWMSTRALGIMGDQASVPDLIHLLYHNYRYARWWAQVSLVRLTGQNFGSDWEAWGHWWNSHHGQPPFKPQPVRWHRGQAAPGELALSLIESDKRFVEVMKSKAGTGQLPAEAEEPTGQTLKNQ